MAALLDQGFEQLDVPVMRRAPVGPRLMLIASARASEAPRAQPQPPARLHPAAFTIQVGSFGTEAAARSAAASARRVADGGDVRVESASVGRKPVYRAQVTGLRASDAQEACSALSHRKAPCVVIRPVVRDVASR
jgi:hypothetical protein